MTNRIIISMLAGLSLFVYAHAQDLPDPTRPTGYTTRSVAKDLVRDEAAEFNLTAIRIHANNRTAIINGKLLEVGSSVGSARVMEIHPAYVVLDHDKKQVILRLYSLLNKTPRKAVNETGDS